jgi:hypothetical protein
MPAREWSPARFRATRYKRESERRRANTMLLLAADSRVRYRGVDHAVVALAENAGFERFDLTIVRVALQRRTMSLIIAPRRLWHTPEGKSQLLLLKREARSLSIRCILVSEGALKKEPRLANARLIAGTSNTQLTHSQRFRVEMYVLSTISPVSLSECAGILPDHDDPVSAVLSLVRAGVLFIPLDTVIGPETLVFAPLRVASHRGE